MNVSASNWNQTCSQCGAQMPNEARRCWMCGADTPVAAPAGGTENGAARGRDRVFAVAGAVAAALAVLAVVAVAAVAAFVAVCSLSLSR